MEHECSKTSEIERNKEDIDKIFGLCEKIRTRLPNWATFTFSVLTLAIGWLARMKL